MLERLARAVVRRRYLVIAVVVLLSGIAAYGASKLRLNADFSTYLTPDDPLVQAYNSVGERFHGNAIGLALVTAPDVFDGEALRVIDGLTEAFRQIDGIEYVTSLTDVVDFKKTEWGLDVGRLIAPGDFPETREESDALRAYVLGKDRLVGNLVSADGTAAVIALRFGSGSGDEAISEFKTARRVGAVTEEVIASLQPAEDTEIYFGGMPFLVYNMTTLISDNMMILEPIILLVLLFVLYLGFRRWGGVLYPITVVLVSTLWTLGLMGYMGLSLDLLTGIMPVILIALGSADGIHFMKRYYEHRSTGEKAADAARACYTEMGVPLIATTLTTMVGFASLAISDFAVIRQFGLMTSAGLFLALLVTLTLLPALTSFGGSGSGVKSRKREEKDSALMRRTARFVYRRKGSVLIGGAAILLLALAALPRIYKDVDWTLCLAKGSPPFHAEMLLREKFGGSLPVQITVDGDLKDPAILNAMLTVERYIDALPSTGKSQSIAPIIAEMNDAMNDRYAIPADREGVANLWFLIEDEEMMEQMVGEGDRDGLIQARVDSWGTEAITGAVKGVAALLDSLPRRWSVLDMSRIPGELEGEVQAARRSRMARNLALIMAGRGIGVEPDRLQPLTASLLRWEPDAADLEALSAALERYMLSDESEYPLEKGPAGRLAREVAAAWRSQGPLPVGTIETMVKRAAPAADSWESRELAASLRAVSDDTVGRARVGDALASLEQLVPEIAGDPILLRNVRGALWEANDPVWAVGTPTAERLGLAGGPAELRTVEVQFTRSGMASVLNQMEAELLPTQVRSLATTVLFVIVILALIFRSPIAGLLAVVPLLLTILVNFGVMATARIGLDAFTAMIASIAIGLGIDYAIHFIHRYRTELRAARGDGEATLIRVMQTSGKAIIINALSVGLGFVVLLGAGGQHIRRFGGLTSLSMITAGVFTLILLPALFLWLRPRFLFGREQRAAIGADAPVAEVAHGSADHGTGGG